MTRRVFVGPEPDARLQRAVVDGGGELSDPRDAEAVVWHGPDDPQLTAEYAAADGVRWVQLPHAGVERWTAAGVVTTDPVWTSAAGAFAPQVAEHAVALMLLGARRLHTYARATHWTAKHGETLRGSTVALVGLGGIGRAMLPLLSALGCTVVAVSDSPPVDGVSRTVPRADYRDVLPDSDHVVLLAPSTPATHGMIGRRELDLMRPGAWLVNVARGSLIVTDDLVHALQDGRILGAALDVTDPEPLPGDHPLWHEPRAMITPHSANPSEAHDAALAEHVRANTARFVAGEPLLSVIDPVQGF